MEPSAELDSTVEMILTDSYGDDEQYAAFLTVIEEQTPVPAQATLLGTSVLVTGFDHALGARGVTAVCQTAIGTGEVALADVRFPPETETAWIHAAYRRWLGLQPFPADPRPGWIWPD